jgi:tRNA pseudouridine38-40 synthase
MENTEREKNILLVIEYDGTDFHGWQKQPGERTVQGEIEHVLSFLAGESIDIHGTSRTDSGVHALGQCASFRWSNPLPTERLPGILNKRFGAGGTGRSGAPGDIRIVSAAEMPDDFHARFSCKGKTYKYVIDTSGGIFDRHHVCQLSEPLDTEAMRTAASYLTGTHDFKSFETAGGTPRETTVRTITDIGITAEGSRILIRVTGDGFLYNMVRIIAGTLIEAGTGRRDPHSIPSVIEAKDRSMAGYTAPPQGLYLEKIYFD